MFKHPIEHLKDKPGEELLDRYQDLDPDNERMIEMYQRAIIEKYAEEIGYD
jgi:Fe-S-cluster formation regulator IscX/YfhJ